MSRVDPSGLFWEDYDEDWREGLEVIGKAVSDAFSWIGNNALDLTQLTLDAFGLVPLVGEAADGVNALIYTARGDYLNAGLSVFAMIPIAGWAPTGAKLAGKAVNAVVDIATSSRGARRVADAATVARGAGNVADAARGVRTVTTSEVPRLSRNARTVSNPQLIYRHLEVHHGIDPRLASERLHAIKTISARGPADNVLFDMTGNVYDPVTKEWLGSLTQGGARKIR